MLFEFAWSSWTWSLISEMERELFWSSICERMISLMYFVLDYFTMKISSSLLKFFSSDKFMGGNWEEGLGGLKAY